MREQSTDDITSIFGCAGSHLWHVGSSSLTRDWTLAPCLGSEGESWPQHHQGSPGISSLVLAKCSVVKCVSTYCSYFACAWEGCMSSRGLESPSDIKMQAFSPASHTPLALTIRIFQVLFLVLPPSFLMHSSMCVCVAQSWPTLCYPMDCSRPGSSLHGVFQARILEWSAISFSNILLHTLDLNTVHIYFCIYILSI